MRARIALFSVLSLPGIVVHAAEPSTANEPTTPTLSSSAGIPLTTLIEDYAKRTNQHFVIDPRAQGGVVLAGIDPRRLTARELQTVLRVHGFVAIESDGVMSVVPESTLRSLPWPVVAAKAPANDDDIAIRVIDVKKIEAAQLVPILRPLLPQYAHLAALVQSNSLVVVARYGNVRTIEAIVREMEAQAPEKVATVGTN